jgi:hypothetical protein
VAKDKTRIVEIRHSGMEHVHKTKSFRCQNSGTRLCAAAHLELPELKVLLPP